jgi:hypothetical protein
MIVVWIAVVAALLAGALAAAWARRRRADAAEGATATVSRVEDATTLDRATGAVRSVQTADLVLEERALQEIWTPAHLERLARTYWRFLTRVTLGLVRVRYTPEERSVVLLGPPLRLLTFRAPEYEMDPARGMVRWRI